MPSSPASNTYRNDQYCDIPSVNYGCSIGVCGIFNNRTSPLLTIPNPIDQKLSCGCLAFEYKSHSIECKYYNEKEDQPYYPGCLS